MIYSEHKKDIFTMGKEWYLAHCISSDYRMGAGIAVPMSKKFKLHSKLKNYERMNGKIKYPMCILTDRVFNLITKKKYSGKPTICSVKDALIIMKTIVVENNITKVAMPKIGCGLDGLSWPQVRIVIQEVFCDIENLEIVVCHK